MTAHKPTPGPWRYSEEELWGAVYGDSHELVATVLPGILDKNKVVATARLIAAAPDMANALEAMLARFGHHCCAGDFSDGMVTHSAGCCVDAATQALKKARGET
jgi:hypothetical protein